MDIQSLLLDLQLSQTSSQANFPLLCRIAFFEVYTLQKSMLNTFLFDVFSTIYYIALIYPSQNLAIILALTILQKLPLSDSYEHEHDLHQRLALNVQIFYNTIWKRGLDLENLDGEASPMVSSRGMFSFDFTHPVHIAQNSLHRKCKHCVYNDTHSQATC